MGANGALEKALEELIERVLENRLQAWQQQLRQEIRDAVASTPARVTVAAPPSAAPSLPEAPRAAASEALPALQLGVSQILQPTSQTEILNVFLQSAEAFCGRCAVFVLRGGTFGFWRGKNFTEETAGRLRTITLPASQSGIFKEICDSLLAVSSSRSPESLPEGLCEALEDATEPAIYAFPILVHGRVVAALYADSGAVAGSVEPSALEILARVAGLSLETISIRQSARAAAASAPTSTVGVSPEPTEEIQPEAASAATAESTPLMAESPTAPPGSFAATFAPAAAIETPAAEPPPDTSSLPQDVQEIHRRAHRFARVAVQDLLSYHKDKIEQGRTNKNLYQLLREDIEKTRENYQKRFCETEARSFDYFHYELVVKLANNDPSTLGTQYPGPVRGEL
ncbi:MAG: hypothetical protein HY647_01000 [Acidobacteria bacterium]|nr:hypothetical protein [Acidobacteriota bacterium]